MPTRLAAETDLAGRVDGLAYFVYVRTRSPLSGRTPLDITPTGTNALYNTPLAFALSHVGTLPADPSAVVDTDLAAVPPAKWCDFGELAEFKFLTIALNNYTQTDETALDLQQSWNAMALRFNARVAALADQLKPYLANKYKVAAGRVRLPIQDRRWGGEWAGYPGGWPGGPGGWPGGWEY